MNKLPASTLSAMSRTALFVALVTMGLAPLAVEAAPSHHRSHACRHCGTVISTHMYQKAAPHGSGVGIAAGVVVGGLLGNHVGGGNGRSLATVAGAVGGGYAGNEIEKRTRTTTVTTVRVRMSDGSVRTFTEAGNARRHSGQHVKVKNGALVAR